MTKTIIHGDNLPVLQTIADESVDLIYIDPPFNTGRKQKRDRIKTVRVEDGGDRIGFKGNRYKTVKVGSSGFDDAFTDYLEFLGPRLEEAYRTLSKTGSFFFHIDYREAHYCKVFLDELFGHGSFMNEIIWAYDYGGRSKKKWPAKHDTIFWYAKNPKKYTFNFDEVDRIPYMVPGLVGPEKANGAKHATDVWWHTIVSPTGKEKTGYATQKPLGLLERIVKVHSNPGDLLLDFFAGSGTFGEAAAIHNRNFMLVDCRSEAIKIMARRLSNWEPRIEVRRD